MYKVPPLMFDLLKETAKHEGEELAMEFVQLGDRREVRSMQEEESSVLLVVLQDSTADDWKMLEELKTAFPQLPVLLLVASASKETLHMALKYRVDGLVTQEQSLSWILSVLHKLAKGEKYFDADAMIQMIGEDASVLEHDCKLLILLAREKDRHAIAKQLHIGVRTVDLHLKALRKKLGVSTNIGLALYAKRVGLV